MAELMFPDIAGSFMRGQQFGTQQRQEREQEQRRSGLASLAQQAYTADPSQREGLIGQAIGIDPAAGMALGEGLQGNDDRRTKSMVNMAKMLTAAPEQYRAGLYQQMVPALQQMGLSQLPPQYDETVAQTAQAIVQAYGGGQGAEQFTLGPGSKRFNPDGSVVAEVPFAPANAQYVDVPDGQGGSVKMLLDPRSQQFTAPQFPGAGGQAGPMAAPAGNPQEDYRSLASMFGAQITSLDRSPADNQRVGGVANSQHMRGTAGDFVVPPAAKPAFIAAARSRGYEAIDEGDHVHLELPPGGSRGGALGYTPPKSETASAPSGYRFGASGNLEAIPGGPADPNVSKPMTPAQRMKLEQTQRKERQMVGTMEASFDQSIKLIDDVLSRKGDFKGVTGLGRVGSMIPGSDWADVATKLDTLRARSAFGALQEMRANSPTGGALGSVSERELYLLQNAETQLQDSQSPESLEQSLKDYKATLMAAKRRMKEGVSEFYQQEGLQSDGGIDFARAAPGAAPANDIDSLLDLYR